MRRFWWGFVRTSIFVVLTFFLAYGDPRAVTHRIVGNPGDAFLIYSLLVWGGSRLTHLLSGYSSGPMFAGGSDAMAYSDTFLPLTIPFRMMEAFGLSPTTAFNVLYLTQLGARVRIRVPLGDQVLHLASGRVRGRGGVQLHDAAPRAGGPLPVGVGSTDPTRLSRRAEAATRPDDRQGGAAGAGVGGAVPGRARLRADPPRRRRCPRGRVRSAALACHAALRGPLGLRGDDREPRPVDGADHVVVPVGRGQLRRTIRLSGLLPAPTG